MIPLYYNARSLWARRLSTGVTVLGLGLVVFVFASVLMLSNGIRSALAAGGSPQNVLFLRGGATSEVASVVDRAVVQVLTTEPEVATSVEGEPLGVGEVVVLVSLPRGKDNMNITARGIDEKSFAVRPKVRIVEGRAPRPGSFEVITGVGLSDGLSGAYVGGELQFARQRWPVVGRFTAGGGAYESELWTDASRLSAAFDRPGFSSATVRLRSADLVPAFIAKVKADPRFTLDARREDTYWAEQATGLSTFIRVLGLFVSFVFSLGAVLGAMITMYAQVAARVRELGMMRAVGFRRRSVLGSVVVESMLLGAAGGVAGALGALAMSLVQIRTLNFQTFSVVRFGFSPTPGILLAALLFGTAMGTLGGLLPARRAARLSVLDAIQA